MQPSDFKTEEGSVGLHRGSIDCHLQQAVKEKKCITGNTVILVHMPLQGSLGGTQETAYKYLQMLQATLRKALWCANEWPWYYRFSSVWIQI